jgi:hypothetical protein
MENLYYEAHHVDLEFILVDDEGMKLFFAKKEIPSDFSVKEIMLGLMKALIREQAYAYRTSEVLEKFSFRSFPGLI